MGQENENNLLHPLAVAYEATKDELAADQKRLDSIKTDKQHLLSERDAKLSSAREHEKPYIKRTYDEKINELARASEKIEREIGAREGRALRMEPDIPAHTGPVGWRRVHGELGGATAERMWNAWLGQRGSVKELLEGKLDGQLRQQAAWVKRGIRLMEIQGHPDARELGYVGATATERLVSLIAKGKVRGGMAEAVMRAMAMGKVMDAAEFNQVNKIYPIPPRVRGEGARRKVRLLMARCDAMGLPSPDLFQLTEAQLWAAIRTNAVLHRLTSEDSSYMRDYSEDDPTDFIGALMVLETGGKETQEIKTDPVKLQPETTYHQYYPSPKYQSPSYQSDVPSPFSWGFWWQIPRMWVKILMFPVNLIAMPFRIIRWIFGHLTEIMEVIQGILGCAFILAVIGVILYFVFK